MWRSTRSDECCLKAVFDSSPLIAFFFELKSPETLLLLQRLDYELMVPESVFAMEIVREPTRGVLDHLVQRGDLAVLDPIDPSVIEAFQARYPSLGRGESEAILSAKGFLDMSLEAQCILDESPARRIAGRLGVPVVGTIGLIRALEHATLISTAEARGLLSQLGASTFRVDRKLLG